MSYIAHFWYFGFLWAACWALISVFGSPWSSAQTQQYAFQAPWDASLLFGTGDAVCTARQPDIEATYGPAGFTGITHTSTGDATRPPRHLVAHVNTRARVSVLLGR